MEIRGKIMGDFIDESYRLLNAEEVAEILNVSRAHVYNMMKKGIIPTVYMARSCRVRPEDLDLFIRSNRHSEIDYGSFFGLDHEI